MAGRKFCGRAHALEAGLRVLFIEAPGLAGLIDHDANMVDTLIAGTKFDGLHIAPLVDRNWNDKIAIDVIAFRAERVRLRQLEHQIRLA